MNRHVGASFTLSVLVVVFFAVILYEPEHARYPARPSPAGSASDASRPEPTPGVALSEATAEPPPGASSSFDSRPAADRSPAPIRSSSLATDAEPFAAPGPAAASRRFPRRSAESVRSRVVRTGPPAATEETEAPPRPRVRTAARLQSPPPARRSAFTRVVAGESLSDVALRVYGNPDAAGTLWLVNRDLINRRDAPLTVGMLLRTP